MKQYEWPGNVRELNNVVSKLYYMADEDEISTFNIPRHILYANKTMPAMPKQRSLGYMVEELEKHLVIQTLKETNNNISQTAKILKISRPKLYQIIEKISKETSE